MNVKSEANSPPQSRKQGFSAKEMGAFLDQAESQLPRDGLIVEIVVIGKLLEVTTVKNATEQRQRFYFEKIDEEWKKKSVESCHADPTQNQKQGMPVKEIRTFFIQVENLFTKDEGIVGAKMFEKQIKLRTANIYIPLAGRGRILTFEKVNEEWRKVAESEWMS